MNQRCALCRAQTSETLMPSICRCEGEVHPSCQRKYILKIKRRTCPSCRTWMRLDYDHAGWIPFVAFVSSFTFQCLSAKYFFQVCREIAYGIGIPLWLLWFITTMILVFPTIIRLFLNPETGFGLSFEIRGNGGVSVLFGMLAISIGIYIAAFFMVWPFMLLCVYKEAFAVYHTEAFRRAPFY